MQTQLHFQIEFPRAIKQSGREEKGGLEVKYVMNIKNILDKCTSLNAPALY